jgi:hypothetical protein
MLTPRSSKPVNIPSIAPLAPDAGPNARRRVSPATSVAWIRRRAGELFRPRGDRVSHRRLVDGRSETPPGTGARHDDAGTASASTFRGATARFVALG